MYEDSHFLYGIPDFIPVESKAMKSTYSALASYKYLDR